MIYAIHSNKAYYVSNKNVTLHFILFLNSESVV